MPLIIHENNLLGIVPNFPHLNQLYRIRENPLSVVLNDEMKVFISRIVCVLETSPRESLERDLVSVMFHAPHNDPNLMPLLYSLVLEDTLIGPKYSRVLETLGPERALPLLRPLIE